MPLYCVFFEYTANIDDSSKEIERVLEEMAKPFLTGDKTVKEDLTDMVLPSWAPTKYDRPCLDDPKRWTFEKTLSTPFPIGKDFFSPIHLSLERMKRICEVAGVIGIALESPIHLFGRTNNSNVGADVDGGLVVGQLAETGHLETVWEELGTS